MPTCLDCGIRVPPVNEWGRNKKTGRRIKPCVCGLPAEQRREALAAQKKWQYESKVAELARTSWPVSALLKVVARGNSGTIYMATSYLEIKYGDRWVAYDKRVPNVRFWAKLRDDLLAAMGGEEENIRREACYAKQLASACHKVAHALRIDERYGWSLYASEMPVPEDSTRRSWATPQRPGWEDFDSFYDHQLVYGFLHGDLACFVC